MTALPSAYFGARERAQGLDTDLIDLYLENVRAGDPEADAVLAALASFPEAVGQSWIRAGIEKGPMAISDAPPLVREFFAEIERVPDWFEPSRVLAGCRAFHRHSEMFIGAFVGAVLIEGFSTLISKSFSITGRLTDQGVQRLKQNNRHLLEIFVPGGLDRHGDGWKLSVRIRLIHARVRSLLSRSDDWDATAWGVPLSSSHVAFATAAFSGLLLKRVAMLGVRLSDEERESFMMIWRYSGRLMGVPDRLCCDGEAAALRLHSVGTRCEPPPGIESKLLANGLINSAPIVAGIDNPVARRRLTAKIYRVSRALIGDQLANALNYPPSRSTGVLAVLRGRNRLEEWVETVFPAIAKRRRVGQFQQMMGLSHYDAKGLAYRLPERVYAEVE